MSAPDPHDARAVLVALRGKLTATARAVDAGWRCERILPLIDGRAELTLTRDDSPRVLDWLPPARPPDTSKSSGRHWGRLQARDEGTDPVLVRRLSASLARSLKHPSMAMLPFVNRNRKALPYNDGIADFLLADRMAPEHTRWYDYVFSGALQQRADRFQLRFTGPHGVLVFEVRAPWAPAPEGQLLIDAPQFRLSILDDPRPAEVRARLSAQVERLLGFLLCRAVHPRLQAMPPNTIGATTGADHQSERGEQSVDFTGAPVSTSRWGNGLQWHQFFSDFEIARDGACNVQFDAPVSWVIHGEPECLQVEPSVRPFPHVYARMPFQGRRVTMQNRSQEYISKIGERETVFGGDEVLQTALRAAVASADTSLVCINNTCLPKMVGDDVDSLIKGFRSRTDKPILNMNTDLDSPEATFLDLVSQTLGDEALPAEQQAQLGRAGVGLLGTPPGRERDELGALLTALGAQDVVYLVPELSVEGVGRYRHCRARALYPRTTWQDLHERLFADELPLPPVLPAPVGLTDSRTWFVGLAEQLGLSERVEAVWAEQCAAHETALGSLREAAQEHRVAAVVDVQSAPRLYQAERLYGVRLLPLLEELGFGLDVLLLDPEQGAGAERVDAAEAGLRQSVENPDGLQIQRFATPDELESQLAAGPFELVYTELACDQRLSRSGRTGFGLADIELGPAGAVRSLRRLLHRARWPFHRRYGRHLPARAELAEVING